MLWRGTVWRGVLHGIWRCRVKMQRLKTVDARNKTENEKFLFLNSIYGHYVSGRVFVTVTREEVGITHRGEFSDCIKFRP